MHDYSPAAQHARFLTFAATIRQRFRPLLDAQGHSDRLLWWDQPRVELWASQAFLAGDAEDVRFGNVILRHVRDVLHASYVPGPDVFGASATASVLAAHEQRLDPDVRDYFLAHLQTLIPFGLTADFQFHGYNDNMPVMWTWALTFAGDHFQRADWQHAAWANLRQLTDLLRRRGTVAEYGSGYATHRLTGIAHIVEHAQDPVCRELARAIEARLWAELAGHWHPALGFFCGASMRGGPPHNGESTVMLAQVFGPQLLRPWQAIDQFFDGSAYVRELGKDPAEFIFAYPYGYGAEFAAASYHVPAPIAALFYARPAGSWFSATAECGYVNDGIFCKQVPVYGTGGILITTRLTTEVVTIPDCPAHGAQPHQLTTCHGRHFALGTATANMFPTSHALRCTYRRAATPATSADLGDLFIRYNINDKQPSGRLKQTYWKSPEYHYEAENYCSLYLDQGRHFCLQHERTVLCLSTPLYREYWQVRDLRLELLLYQPTRPVRAIYVGGQLVTSLPCELPAAARIDIDEGATYMSLLPLIGRHLDRPCALRLRLAGDYLVISLLNYQGPSRAFEKHELAKYGNGFVLEARDADDYRDFAAFQADMAQARCLDQLYGGRRRVHYARPGLRLSTHYCPYTHTVMSASINGVEQQPTQLAFSGGEESTLPLRDRAPSPGFEDWDWITTQMQRPHESYNPVD